MWILRKIPWNLGRSGLSKPPMRTRVLAGAPLLLGLFALTTSSRADVVQGTRSELLTERLHAIELTFAPGHATLRVRRVLDNQGPRHDQAVVDIDLPNGAVATGLRTLGSLHGEPTWFDAELMEAEAAAAKYKELTGIGGWYPKDPALLSWRSPTHLKLQVFPVAPKSRKSVEYTLEMPTEYEAGHDVLHLARLGTEERAALVTVMPADPRDKIRGGGKVIPPGTRLQFTGDEPLDLVLERHDVPRLGGELAVVPFARQRVLTRGRVEVSSRLSQAPRGASVVVVMDASRSLSAEDVVAERAAAATYLAHMPDANVEVITFDREPHRRYGRFASAATAIADLARTVVARRNGSSVDLAIAEAEKVLLASPPGPRRVVVMSDLRTRSSLAPERLRAAFTKSGAVVHVASVVSGAPMLLRNDDDSAWAAVARATGGVQWMASASDEPGTATEMQTVFEEWARPLRIDRLSAKTPGVADELGIPESLAEGASFEVLRLDVSPMTTMMLKGELWSSPIHATLQPDAAANKRWAALVFGSSILSDLTEPEQATLAKLGHAVSPVTSLLAIEPGVRPSTEGLDDGESIGAFGIGHGRLGAGHGVRGHSLRSFDHAAFLKASLGQAWAACGGTGRAATVDLETTRAEIVDVPRLTVAGSGTGPKPAEDCLKEATWSLELPAAFEAAHASFSISL